MEYSGAQHRIHELIGGFLKLGALCREPPFGVYMGVPLFIEITNYLEGHRALVNTVNNRVK